jgi:hypothetical protein
MQGFAHALLLEASRASSTIAASAASVHKILRKSLRQQASGDVVCWGAFIALSADRRLMTCPEEEMNNGRSRPSGSFHPS